MSGLRILHVAAGYPDPLRTETRAVLNLLTLVPEHDHKVYSICRVGWRSGIAALDFDDAAGSGHRAVAYGAPPKGLFLSLFLDRLADWIAEDVSRRRLEPDLVHAHKLSVEGLVGLRLAERFGVPLMVSAQGDSDLKIIGAKPETRARWRQVWSRAAVLFPFAPWTYDRLAALFGQREGPRFLLPCPTPADALSAPRSTGPVFRTAFHFGYARRKNAAGLIAALGSAAAAVPDIRLEVIGGGDPQAFCALRRAADRAAPGRVRFLGARPHAEVQALMGESCAFVLPSRRESYGMVFAEALLAGAPCLIPRGWAIDGYLPDGEVTLAVEAGDVSAIRDALVRLARDESAFKSRLARLGESGGLAFLQRAAIAEAYRAGIAAAGARATRAA
jgi:glycosyltransferase involved in cell wall biosynthesis